MSKSKTYKDHYDGSMLVNSKDANGLDPLAFIVVSHLRGPGKTYWFSRYLINKFLDEGKKFILLTRNIGDVGHIASGVLDSYLKDTDFYVTEKAQMHGIYSIIELCRIDEEGVVTSAECGYCLAINACDKLKLISSTFYDAWAFFFDEFQPANKSSYLPDEFDKVFGNQGLYKSIARGEGHATRYMPVFMCSNTIQIQNPYFRGFSLTKNIQKNTKFYKGSGVVFEKCDVEGLAEEHDNTALARATKAYYADTDDNSWLNDYAALVEKPSDWGRATYICTLMYKDQKLGLYKYNQAGLTYVSRSVDKTCKYIYRLTLDGKINHPLLSSSDLMKRLKDSFYKGCVRCSDVGINDILIELLS